MRVRKGDTVVVIAGKEKGKRGKVLRVLTEERAASSSSASTMVKRHTKPTPAQPAGRHRREGRLDPRLERDAGRSGKCGQADAREGRSTTTGSRSAASAQVRHAVIETALELRDAEELTMAKTKKKTKAARPAKPAQTPEQAAEAAAKKAARAEAKRQEAAAARRGKGKGKGGAPTREVAHRAGQAQPGRRACASSTTRRSRRS